jgi:mevalonate kinase
MEIGLLICYTLGRNATSIQRNKLRKLLLGYTDYSNKGRYRYFRDGLLTKIPSIRIIRSVFIVRKEDSEKVIDLLEKFGATVYVRRVILTKEDCRKLGLEPE